MKQPSIFSLLVMSGFVVALSGAEKPAGSQSPVPAAWLSAWSQPPSSDRPLQIIHGVDSGGALPEGIHQMLREKGPAAITPDAMHQYKARGLGGVVTNVAFHGYLESEANWANLARAVAAFAKLDMVVWFYDEEGYPSGAAGGLVLRENRDFQATELAFDPSRPDPFVVRPAYEYTHASNNYYAARRYVNLLDDRAIRCFLAKTHEAYWKRLGPYFGSTVQATFTDEPSLIAINLGQIPESVRKTVPVIDTIDPNVRPLRGAVVLRSAAAVSRTFRTGLAAVAAEPVRRQRGIRPRRSPAILVAGGRPGGRAVFRRDPGLVRRPPRRLVGP